MNLPIFIHVMPTARNYNLLLGTPWIYTMKVVYSTLHCIIKFIHDSEIQTIKVDSNPYDVVQDKLICRSPFHTTIPSIAHSPIDNSFLEDN